MTTVLIPAKYPSERWEVRPPKQLSELDGETILDRLVRMCKRRGIQSRVISPSHPIRLYGSKKHWQMGYADPLWSIVQVVEQTEYWDESTIFLLGDVIMQGPVLDYILRDDTPLRFYGNSSEIFAVKFDSRGHDQLNAAIETTISYQHQHPEDPGAGKLWYLFKACIDHPQGDPLTQFHTPLFMWVNGWTTDIDTVEEYEAFKRDVVDKGLLDERVTT